MGHGHAAGHSRTDTRSTGSARAALHSPRRSALPPGQRKQRAQRRGAKATFVELRGRDLDDVELQIGAVAAAIGEAGSCVGEIGFRERGARELFNDRVPEILYGTCRGSNGKTTRRKSIRRARVATWWQLLGSPLRCVRALCQQVVNPIRE